MPIGFNFPVRPLFGRILTETGVDIKLPPGDSDTIPFVVLEDPHDLDGAWTWDGTTTVLSTDTSGVSVGDWIRLEPKRYDVCPIPFKVTAINANVDVTIENPYFLKIESGTGAEVSSPVDITDAAGKFAAKRDPANTDVAADIWKTTYVGEEVVYTDALAGEGYVRLITADTIDLSSGTLKFDMEFTRRDIELTAIGTLTPTNGSKTLAGSGIDFTLFDKGDLVVLQSADPANNQSVTITALQDPDIETDFDEWTTEGAQAIKIYRGNRKTPAGLCGDLVLLRDVVRS